jgi:hypothetical protein
MHSKRNFYLSRPAGIGSSKIVWRITIVMVLAATTFATHADASPPQKQTFQMRGLGVFMTSFFLIDNCQGVNFVFNAAESVTRTGPGGGTGTSSINLFADLTNQCTNAEAFLNVSGEAVITGTVSTQVRVTGQVAGTEFDFSTGTSTPVSGTVDVVLTPTDNPENTHSESTFGSRFYFQRIHSVGLSAPATPTGSIVVGGTDYLAAAMGSGFDIYTTVNRFNSGDMIITK